MAAVASTISSSQNAEQATISSPSPSPPIANATEQPSTSSRSFIHLGSPRAQNTSFPVTPMSAVTTTILDSPAGSSFAEYLRTWSDAHVAKWLAEIKCPAHIDTFKQHDIRGDVLLELDQDTLKEMKILSVGDKLRILNGVKGLRQRCQSRTSSPPVPSLGPVRTYLSAYGETRILESPRDSPRTNTSYTSHSRENSRDGVHRDNSISRAPKRLENKPAPLVLSNQGRGDLPRVIREPLSGDSARSIPAIRPLPQPVQTGSTTLSTTPNGTFTSTRPSLPPLPPAPRGQPPQPPTNQSAGSRLSPTTRTLHPLSAARSRTPNQDPLPYSNSPLPPAPGNQGALTPISGTSSWSSYGLPSDPRPNTLKPPMSSLLASPRSANNPTHGRNTSFGGVSSPMGFVPLPSKQRPSTSGTTNAATHPYASAQPPTVQSPHGGAALSPIAESHLSGSSPGSASPPAAGFTVGRSPLSHPSHSHTSSSDERHRLVKFILPEEGRSYVIDVADCTGGIEVMEKVLRKPNVSARKNDSISLTNRVETEDGGLCIDGWCVYIEWGDQRGSSKYQPLS